MDRAGCLEIRVFPDSFLTCTFKFAKSLWNFDLSACARSPTVPEKSERSLRYDEMTNLGSLDDDILYTTVHSNNFAPHRAIRSDFTCLEPTYSLLTL